MNNFGHIKSKLSPIRKQKSSIIKFCHNIRQSKASSELSIIKWLHINFLLINLCTNLSSSNFGRCFYHSPSAAISVPQCFLCVCLSVSLPASPPLYRSVCQLFLSRSVVQHWLPGTTQSSSSGKKTD